METRWKLNYTNAELACHAIEMYTERLREGEEDKLKVNLLWDFSRVFIFVKIICRYSKYVLKRKQCHSTAEFIKV